MSHFASRHFGSDHFEAPHFLGGVAVVVEILPVGGGASLPDCVTATALLEIPPPKLRGRIETRIAATGILDIQAPRLRGRIETYPDALLSGRLIVPVVKVRGVFSRIRAREMVREEEELLLDLTGA